jgi:class 3 adenylate cyclase
MRVRVAVHTGEAELRDRGNYFGMAVIRCARLRSLTHGGQVLVSAATADPMADRLPRGARLVDRGESKPALTRGIREATDGGLDAVASCAPRGAAQRPSRW